MSKPSELGSLKIGSYILLPVDSPNAEPCRIVEYDTSKPGKHGAAKAFPYGDNLIVLEVSSDNTHQSDNKYCEKTRKEVARKGIRLTNLLNLSVIEKIK